MFIDASKRWIRRDKLAKSETAQVAVTGVDGDPTQASAEWGKIFLDQKIDAAVAQIRELRAARK
jgi:creatinine amidohydrolase/Fe(II)-dependent formamide hydrolase-like protein